MLTLNASTPFPHVTLATASASGFSNDSLWNQDMTEVNSAAGDKWKIHWNNMCKRNRNASHPLSFQLEVAERSCLTLKNSKWIMFFTWVNWDDFYSKILELTITLVFAMHNAKKWPPYNYICHCKWFLANWSDYSKGK